LKWPPGSDLENNVVALDVSQTAQALLKFLVCRSHKGTDPIRLRRFLRFRAKRRDQQGRCGDKKLPAKEVIHSPDFAQSHPWWCFDAQRSR
jgi:hypothetical protein